MIFFFSCGIDSCWPTNGSDCSSTANNINKTLASTYSGGLNSNKNNLLVSSATTTTETTTNDSQNPSISITTTQRDGQKAADNNNLNHASLSIPNNNRSNVPTSSAFPSGLSPNLAAAINNGHDLFVHIHPGESIALSIGSEIQTIHGRHIIYFIIIILNKSKLQDLE